MSQRDSFKCYNDDYDDNDNMSNGKKLHCRQPYELGIRHKHIIKVSTVYNITVISFSQYKYIILLSFQHPICSGPKMKIMFSNKKYDHRLIIIVILN